MFRRIIALSLLITALILWGCPKDDDKDPVVTPTPTSDVASGQVRSDATTTTTIETPAGARLVIPPGAVPYYNDSTVATQTFSIERSEDALPTLPAGETAAGKIYRFGPEGFTFAAPIELTIPVPDAPDSALVRLYRWDTASGQLIRANATYDPVNHVIHAQTYHFSPWFPTWGPRVNTASGCVYVNNVSNRWVRVCVDSYTLRFPEQAEWVGGGDGGLWAPPGTIGWANASNFYLPQGDYHLCIQYGSADHSEMTYSHRYADVSIQSAWDYWEHPNCSATLGISDPVDADTGMCVCIPHPTEPVHTGAVQVTLTWSVPDGNGRDLDLHVIEPSGEEIYYGHQASATGGQLDRDMVCGFRDGQENIFWTTNPPNGEYVVKVHYFPSSCSVDSIYAFDVRAVTPAATRTFSRSVHYSETVEVTRFTVSGSTVQFLPPKDPPVYQYNLPPKTQN